ncbi:DUF3817 domain-containing protein [Paenarthrobacter sp. YAF11_1]|uniref:DUF3817 domain-containing protein n=1 Tax=Paenarthrobacter sp. YAF11_1 TaxID=3233074 RepID=UPI003F986A95
MTIRPIDVTTQSLSTGRFFRRAFRSASLAEGISWAGLIAALIIKYPLSGNPFGVTIWGWIHGVVWLAVVAATIAAAIRFRWPWWALPAGLVVSVLPFLSVPFDLWMERTGRLRAGWRSSRSGGRPYAPMPSSASKS